MLSDRYCDSEVIFRKVRPNIFISENYINSYNGVLRVFCPLQQ